MKGVGVFLLVLSAHAVAATLPGPCREWLSPCQGGHWQCISEEEYQRYRQRGPLLGCPVSNSPPPTPPPGQQCQLVNGTCQYTRPILECVSQTLCNVPLCNSASFFSTLDVWCPQPANNPSPPPDNLCLPINGSCQWFNPCRAYRGHCLSPYRCGTISEYYAFLFGPIPGCALPPEGWVEPIPPGECVVNANQECAWSNCTAFMDWCQTSWTCGTQYDHALQQASPPPPCPAPPPDYIPPPQPGHCVFSLEAQRCQFQSEPPPTAPATPPATSPVCSQGKQYTTCGSACPVTCSNYRNPPGCIEVCVQGCECPGGTVWDDHTSRGCIQPSQCEEADVDTAPTCPEGMQHTTCGSSCPVTCGNHDDPPACIQTCVEGCVCAEGTILIDEASTKCIAPSRCDEQERNRGLWVDVIGRFGVVIIVLLVSMVVVIVVLLCFRRHFQRRIPAQSRTVDASPLDEPPKYSELSIDTASESSFEKFDLSLQPEKVDLTVQQD